MSKIFRLIIVSVAFWIVLNFVAVRQLSESDRDNARRAIRNSIAKLVSVRSSGQRPDRAPSDAKSDPMSSDDDKEIEPEDSASGSDSSSSGSGSGGSNNAESASVRPRDHPHHHSARSDSDPEPPKKRSLHRANAGSPAVDTKAPSGHPKKAKEKDPLPRSLGNSAHAAATAPVTIRADKVRFMVVGDWGGPGREPQRNVANAMSTVASSDANHALHFVVSTGDNMYEDGVSGVTDKKFQRNFEHVYTQPPLQVRWYMSLGNHDHGAHGVIRDAQAEVNYTKLSSRWFLPSTYYSQTFHIVPHDRSEQLPKYTLDLFVLDTYDYSPRVTQMTDDQLRWFEASLKSSTADVKLVVGHRPLFSAGAKHGSSPYMQKKLEPLFVKYGVSAYLCGDDHELQLLQSKGVLHMLSGGGARAKKDLKPNGVSQTVFQAGVHGFMFAAVNRSHVEVEVYNMHGEKLYSLAHPTLSAHGH